MIQTISNQNNSTRSIQAGFTLLELIIVMAIIAIMFGVSLSAINLPNDNPANKIQTQIYTTIDTAKKFAINHNKIIRVVADDVAGIVYVQYLDTKDNIWKKLNTISEIDYANRGEEIIINYEAYYVLIYPNGEYISENFVLNTDEEVIQFNFDNDKDAI